MSSDGTSRISIAPYIARGLIGDRGLCRTRRFYGGSTLKVLEWVRPP